MYNKHIKAHRTEQSPNLQKISRCPFLSPIHKCALKQDLQTGKQATGDSRTKNPVRRWDCRPLKHYPLQSPLSARMCQTRESNVTHFHSC
ncbi:hypothetical protein CDAR_617561 [Caerostris darwini]|uniref:Uncharacterized protein n=1 Tax=Caerostris darwini TaxID=1538125 RepID=A0AAV4VRP1_9ARAC|nr:hypothetical protein CDAR_617561 [Caerostris darwini]